MWRAQTRDPSLPVLLGLAVILTAVFALGFKHSEPVARLLPLAAGALCISLLLAPQRNTSILLMYALGLSIPFAHFALVVVAGEGVQWAHLFAGLLIVHLIARTLLGHRIPVAPASPWVLGLLAASIISVFGFLDQPGEHVTEFWKSEVQLLFGVLLFFAVIQLGDVRSGEGRMPALLLWMLKAMLIVGVVIALFGIYQLPARYFGWPGGVIELTNPSLSGKFQSVALARNLARAASIFSEPAAFGRYIAGMLAMSLAASMHRPRLFGPPVVLWGIIAIQAMGLALSFSMGSYYLMAELAVVMLLVERGLARGKLIGWLLLMVLLGYGAVAGIERVTGFAVGRYFLDRSYGIVMLLQGDESYMVEGESTHQRIGTARVALDVWLDHPIIGVGVGSYTLVSERYGEWNPQGFAANTLVNTLAEMGLVGFIPMMLFSIATLYALWRLFNRGPPDERSESEWRKREDLALAARMVFYLLVVEVLHFHLGSSLYQPGVWFYFGLAGMIAVLARRRRSYGA